MPYIVDTNPATVGNADTYSGIAPAIAQLRTDLGSDLVAANSGVVQVFLRNSSGVALEETINIKNFGGDANNRIELVMQSSGGFPFVMTDPDGNTENHILSLESTAVGIRAEAEDTGILRANATNSNGRVCLRLMADSIIDGVVLDGVNNTAVGGIYGTGSATVTNTKILRCKRDFYGAIRAGNVTLNRCTIVDCRMVRDAGAITNSIIINTPLSSGDGLRIGTNYNAYDVVKAVGSYVDQAAHDADTNSLFSIDIGTQLIVDPIGGYDLAAGSTLEGAASDGGNIGAFATGIVGNPPVISIDIVGDTLTANVSDDITPNPTLQLYLEGSATGSSQTSTSWDLTSLSLASGVHRITVRATDSDNNSATSNQVYYSVGGVKKIAVLGNSLSQVPVEPASGSKNSLAEEIKAIAQSVGGDIFIEEFILGGSTFVEHSTNDPSINAVRSGNYDVVIHQGEEDDNAYFDQYLRPEVEAAQASGQDFALWSHQPFRDYTTTQAANSNSQQMTSFSYVGAMGIPVSSAWSAALAADPTLDLYADNIHQNSAGAFITALCLYKWLTGNAVNALVYTPGVLTDTLGSTGLGMSAGQVQTLKDAADASITTQFVPSTVNTCVVNMSAPAGAITITEGDSVTFTATATDSSSGDLSANIVWKDSKGTTLHTGNTFTTTSLTTGKLLITAECVGSDGKTSVAARNVTVRSLVNTAPVITTGSRVVEHNANFTQTNLVSLVSDDNDEIDWNTLTITQQPANGVATKDGQTLSTINVDYSGTDYVGADSFKFTVADLDGLTSAEGTVNITVQPINPPSGSILNNVIVRGQSFDISMSNYTAGSGVEVWVIDGGNTYECTVTAHTNETITATCPDSGTITAAIASATIRVRPIV